ncbi:hypothetical protein DYB28_004008 [Aphanomyces astaci]|uniref:Uncharacterized protein n=1 Tax=Aphanomyces astaci TaxID=112090 RepID=A0A397EFL9_APHAT|nr:hypothetical protein DYB25_003306 [Aphanomyces astaci]RHY12708.1 hypothetical protein DYB36_006452 [Aphanomyces astaci]RHY57776.1 hypothetical protein DYB38_011205 [Aphanomyces astaci]RHY84061.1 hypothetical protein DYB31_005103 [Aphanomyces astaci]RHY88553.1 hypothetical protein DYB26_003361 [Aphanomyces astaci]
MVKKGKAVKQVATAAQLLERAETLVDQLQPELAIKFFQKAAALEPNNSEIYDAIGELATEIGDPHTALQAFLKSIDVAPKHNPGKYLYAAQLVQGEESEKFALQGIAHMSASLAHVPDHLDESKLLKKQICDAYCSLGELYMSDLWYVVASTSQHLSYRSWRSDAHDAEAKCEHYLQEALKFDLGLPDATQAMANFRLVQQRTDEAIAFLDETLKRLNACDEHTMPSLEFRIVTGKLLVEVEKFEQAAYVLEGVMQEDDENAEVWFLVGSCYNALEDYDTALEFLERCDAMLSKLQKDMGDEFELDQQLDTVRSLIESIKQIEPVGDDDGDNDQDME